MQNLQFAIAIHAPEFILCFQQARGRPAKRLFSLSPARRGGLGFFLPSLPAVGGLACGRQALVVDATKSTRSKEPTTSSNQPSDNSRTYVWQSRRVCHPLRPCSESGANHIVSLAKV